MRASQTLYNHIYIYTYIHTHLKQFLKSLITTEHAIVDRQPNKSNTEIKEINNLAHVDTKHSNKQIIHQTMNHQQPHMETDAEKRFII